MPHRFGGAKAARESAPPARRTERIRALLRRRPPPWWRQGPRAPLPALREMSMQPPELSQRSAEPKAAVRARSRETRLEGSPQVLVLFLQAPQPRGLLRTLQVRFCLLRQCQEVVAVPSPYRVALDH